MVVVNTALGFVQIGQMQKGAKKVGISKKPLVIMGYTIG